MIREKTGEVIRGYIVKGLVVHVRNLYFRQIAYREPLKPFKTLKQRDDIQKGYCGGSVDFKV